MPGRRLTEAQRRKFYRLTVDPTGPRIGPGAAARECKISRATAYRLIAGWRSGQEQEQARQGRPETELPAPRRFEELPPEAREALADINVFRELYLARRPQVWVYDAAMRIVDRITDKTRRDYLDLNVFPGAGKTTLGTDLVCWLIAGGGTHDPAFGRALRIMVGAEVMRVAVHMVARIRRVLELRRPFYDKDQRRSAERVMAWDFGRFKPEPGLGEERLWAQDQFLVAQLGEIDLYEKEPTVQAASWQAGFLGERVDLAWWDDIATTATSRTAEIAEAVERWFETEAETRLEPGGVLVLVGQRIGPNDLHRRRLDARITTPEGEQVPLYDHIVYPAHHDALCDGNHRQWDPGSGAGCLTDAYRLPPQDWLVARSRPNYRCVWQQEDTDPAQILVRPTWLVGGVDEDGYHAPGCYDRDRGFFQWPEDVGPLIDYVAVDPAAGGWWVAEWWAYQPDSGHNYLIYARRAKISAGDFIDWDNRHQAFRGWMPEFQERSQQAGHPIRAWVIEAVAAHRYLFQFDHFRRWQQANPHVAVIPHQTQINKNDPEYGVQAMLPGRYRSGMKHLPKAPGMDQLNYLRVKERELTTYPYAETDDTVMADWIGEWNLRKIKVLARRVMDPTRRADELKLPPYLLAREMEVAVR